MPKMKTKKSLSGRFKVTGSGKLVRFKSKRRHILSKKSPKKLRQLRKPAVVQSGTADTYLTNLSPGL